ncbi:hypothetical protein ACFSTH_04945 [Paenibacillus yanchengensis]|uniref:DUF3951 domain-containing protein n=1 Tax=Paenibacillus yanchengensis TaxID=2035833 RepID=A0ABW4YK62_9BACL
MRRPKTVNGVAIVVLFLTIVGFIVSLKNNFVAFVIPIVILGGIFLLYKYPPETWRKKNTSTRGQQTYYSPPKTTNKEKRTRSKKVPFRVIDGNKDDDDTPKYH